MSSRSVESPCRVRRRVGVAALAIILATMVVPDAFAQHRPVFVQQDAIRAFDLVTGKGFQTGVVTGQISGTSFVDFQFTPAGPPVGDALPITFHNKVIITDVDGDQLLFDNDGTGTFHLGIPGFPFQGSGGPMTGTYVLTSATGKYSDWTTGTTYAYRAVVTNPPNPPGGLGNVYVEIAPQKR